MQVSMLTSLRNGTRRKNICLGTDTNVVKPLSPINRSTTNCGINQIAFIEQYVWH